MMASLYQSGSTDVLISPCAMDQLLTHQTYRAITRFCIVGKRWMDALARLKDTRLRLGARFLFNSYSDCRWHVRKWFLLCVASQRDGCACQGRAPNLSRSPRNSNPERQVTSN